MTQCSKGVKADHIRYTSSKDAYMLIYARRQSGSSSTGCQLSPEPPLQARRRVAELNRGHDIACASYMERFASARPPALGLGFNFTFKREKSHHYVQAHTTEKDGDMPPLANP